jgi:uroporphyrinogen decarboxylase
MTSRERFNAALQFKEPDRPPHFEHIFELEEEVFGLSFPTEDELAKASGTELELLLGRCSEIYGRIIERFRWDAIVPWRPSHPRKPVIYKYIPMLKKYLGGDIPVGGFVFESFISIDNVKDYMQFSIDLLENRGKLHEWAKEMHDGAIEHAKKSIDCGCDFLSICSDFAFNSGSFISKPDFAEFVTPYLKNVIAYIKSQGIPVLLHSDGNLMGILDQIMESDPDILHSIDPMAGMDIAELKKLTYGKFALMGNVQCNFMQDGPAVAIRGSADYALQHASRGGGYIFSTSNTIFKGVPLENYEIMLDCLHKAFS